MEQHQAQLARLDAAATALTSALDGYLVKQGFPPGDGPLWANKRDYMSIPDKWQLRGHPHAWPGARYVLRGPDERRIYLNHDGRKHRWSVAGHYPVDADGYSCIRGRDVPKISVSSEKDATHLVAHVLRRFLPLYLGLYEQAADSAAKAAKRVAQVEAFTASLCQELLEMDPYVPDFRRTHSEHKHISFNGNGIRGSVDIGPSTAEIKVSSLPHDKAAALCRAIVETAR